MLIVLGVVFFNCRKIFEKKDTTDKTKVVAKFVKKEEEKEQKADTKEEKEEKVMYKVDIKGEVKNPGIYSLEASSRVIDVINLAGGLTENANTTVINLSKKIIDEMVIIIYSNAQVNEFSKTKELEEQISKQCQGDTIKNDACIGDDSLEEEGKISINNATLEELMQLPGIGDAKARDIIKYREENGPFKDIEELKNISGIGDSLFAKIKENITL